MEKRSQDTEEMAGKKRTALMALYGHYEKTPNVIDVKNSRINSGTRSGSSSVEKIRQKQNINKEEKVKIHIPYYETLQQKQIQLTNYNQNEADKRELLIDQQMEVGATLLRKMGWEGTAIGRSGAPAAKPLCAVMRSNREGLGCTHIVQSSTIDEIQNIENRNGDSKKTKLRNKMIDRYQSIK